MRWHPEHKEWDPEGISDVKITQSSGTVFFTAMNFGLFALVKKAADKPFQSWSMKATDSDTTILQLQTSNEKKTIALEINSSQVQVLTQSAVKTEAHPWTPIDRLGPVSLAYFRRHQYGSLTICE